MRRVLASFLFAAILFADAAQSQTPTPAPDRISTPAVAAKPKPVAKPVKAEAPTIALPDSVTGRPGAFIRVKAETNGKHVVWFAKSDDLNVFPSDMLKNSNETVVTGTTGTYVLGAYTALGDVPTEPTYTTIVIGVVTPTPAPPAPTEPNVPTTPTDPAETNASLNRLTAVLSPHPTVAENLQKFYANAAGSVRNDKGGLSTLGDFREWQIRTEREAFANTDATKIVGIAAAIGGFLDVELGLDDVQLDHAKAADALDRISKACGRAVR